jgi:hypothetical protein
MLLGALPPGPNASANKKRFKHASLQVARAGFGVSDLGVDVIVDDLDQKGRVRPRATDLSVGALLR